MSGNYSGFNILGGDTGNGINNNDLEIISDKNMMD